MHNVWISSYNNYGHSHDHMQCFDLTLKRVATAIWCILKPVVNTLQSPVTMGLSCCALRVYIIPYLRPTWNSEEEGTFSAEIELELQHGS